MRELAMRPAAAIALALLQRNQVVRFDDLTNCSTWIGVSRHRRVLRNDTVAVFARHRAAAGLARAGAVQGIETRPGQSRNSGSGFLLRGNLHVLSLPALSTALLLDPPVPLAPGVLQEVELCDRNRNISRRCFDVFHKVDPELTLSPLSSSLTHCCYGLPPYIDFAACLSLHSRNTFILSSECFLRSWEMRECQGLERGGRSGRKILSTNSKVDPIGTHVKVANFDPPCRCRRIRLPPSSWFLSRKVHLTRRQSRFTEFLEENGKAGIRANEVMSFRHEVEFETESGARSCTY